jgi:endogenous inhibitor of DNA gyrase (YacG/DUF329 family)
MKRSYRTCPNCGYKLRWLERVRIAPGFFRKVRPCPSCGITLSWPKWPWWLLNIGTFTLAIETAFLIAFSLDSDEPLIPFGISMILVVIGFLGLRVEIYRPANNTSESVVANRAEGSR